MNTFAKIKTNAIASMLSRRIIRIKGMQLLYAASKDSQLTFKELVERYNALIEASLELYFFSIYMMAQVAKQSELDYEQRKAKHIPTDIDKAFSIKLYSNQALQSFLEKPITQQYIKNKKFDELVDFDIIKLGYKKFTTDEQKVFDAYILQKDNTIQQHIDMMLLLYKYLVKKNEGFVELLFAHYPNWIDDDSLIIGAVKKTFKQMPLTEDFHKSLQPDEEAVNDFGKNLLIYTYENSDQLMEYIQPELKNWESDRLASIDLILLKMGIAEFLTAKTIPGKVTINEYVEIAKAYSTPKSKEFINGVLDKVYKNLEKKGEIQKVGRGLL